MVTFAKIHRLSQVALTSHGLRPLWYEYHFEVSVLLVRLKGTPGYRSQFHTYRWFCKSDCSIRRDTKPVV